MTRRTEDRICQMLCVATCVCVFLLLLSFIGSDAHAQINKDRPINPALHVGAGVVVAAVADKWVLPKDLNPWIRKPLLVLIPIGVGFVKEYAVDLNVDPQDALEWGVGGGLYLTWRW